MRLRCCPEFRHLVGVQRIGRNFYLLDLVGELGSWQRVEQRVTAATPCVELIANHLAGEHA